MARMVNNKQQRLNAANELIKTIASCGRHFFEYQGDVAYLELDPRGRVWLHDEYTKKRIYTHYSGYWSGFTHGGTMRELILFLQNYVVRGNLVPEVVFGPWEHHVCGGDLWGYKDDMQIVRDKALELGIVDKDSQEESGTLTEDDIAMVRNAVGDLIMKIQKKT